MCCNLACRWLLFLQQRGGTRQAAARKQIFLFSHILSLQNSLLLGGGAALYHPSKEGQLAEAHIQLLACLCCFSLASQAKFLTTLLHLAFSPHPQKLTKLLFPSHLCFCLMTAQKVYQNRGSFAMSVTVYHGQAQWNLSRNISKCMEKKEKEKKNRNFITVCMARLKFRGKLLGF